MAGDVFEEHEGTHILQSLDGFALSLNLDGRFLYISETVSIYLGLSQVGRIDAECTDLCEVSRRLHVARLYAFV